LEPFANLDDDTMRAMLERARRMGGDEIASVDPREQLARRPGCGGSRS